MVVQRGFGIGGANEVLGSHHTQKQNTYYMLLCLRLLHIHKYIVIFYIYN